MKVTFKLSPVLRQTILIAKGETLPEKVTCALPLSTLDETTRRLIATYNPDVRENFDLYVPRKIMPYGYEEMYSDNSLYVADVYPESTTDWVQLFQAYDTMCQQRRQEQQKERQERLREIVADLQRHRDNDTDYLPYDLTNGIPVAFKTTPGYDEAVALYQQVAEQVARHKAHQKELARQKREREDQQKAQAVVEKAQREAEKAAWIAEYGSDYLKKCVTEGYDCQRPYVYERAAQEYPGYIVDFQGDADWKDRSAPSPAALDEAARVKGIVVWLTDAPTRQPTPDDNEDDNEWYGFAPCEVVAVRGFLGKYDLIKMM